MLRCLLSFRHRLLLIVALLLTGPSINGRIVHGQEEDYFERIRRVPLVDRPAEIRRAQESLEWKQQLQHAAMDHITMNMERTRAEIEQLEAASAQLSMASSMMLVSDEMRDHLLGRVLEKLLETRVDIAGHNALREGLQEQLETFKNVAAADPSADQAYRKRLEEKLQAVNDRAQRLRDLQAAKVVSDSDLLNSRVEILNLESEIDKLKWDKGTQDQTRLAQAAQPLSDTQLKLHELKAREAMAESQLKELAIAANDARRLRQLRQEIDRLTERLDRDMTRSDEVKQELEEVDILLSKIRNLSPPANESDSTPSKP